MSIKSAEEQVAFLRWQCRRGIKEVEVILLPYFEQKYLDLPEDQQRLFADLLACQDADLFEWFTGKAKAQQPELQTMVEQILANLGVSFPD